MKNYTKCFLSIGIFLSLAFYGFDQAQAAFSMTVTPRRGGQNIRFEASEPGSFLRNEEVTVSVTSTEAAQYHLYLTTYQPLTSEFGNTIPQGAFIAFSPSKNLLGTLRTELETPVMMGQMPVYTSNTAGSSDEFVLVFNIRVPEDQPGGVYRTQMTFTAELVNAKSGVSPSVITMDVRVEIRPTFRMVVKSAKGGNSLDFGHIAKDRLSAAESLNIEIESNIGTPYKIVQRMTEPLIAADGTLLDEEAFSFAVSGLEERPVTSSPTALYVSGDKGSNALVPIQYTLKPEETQKAGVYSGSISLKVESASVLVPSEVFNIPVKIEIEPVFYLDAEMGHGRGLEFGTFKTGEEKRESQIFLTVHTNIGEPYQVTQIFSRKFTNPEGAVIPAGHFTYYGSQAQTGVLAVMSPTPVQEGEAVVFTSDKAGTPAKFILNFSLTVPMEAQSGSYTSDIKYTITSL